MQNQPYVKVYKDGILQNPIIDRYDSGNSMRKLKRNRERFVNLKDKLTGEIKFVLHQIKTNRGKWNTVKILNN